MTPAGRSWTRPSSRRSPADQASRSPARRRRRRRCRPRHGTRWRCRRRRPATASRGRARRTSAASPSGTPAQAHRARDEQAQPVDCGAPVEQRPKNRVAVTMKNSATRVWPKCSSSRGSRFVPSFVVGVAEPDRAVADEDEDGEQSAQAIERFEAARALWQRCPPRQSVRHRQDHRENATRGQQKDRIHAGDSRQVRTRANRTAPRSAVHWNMPARVRSAAHADASPRRRCLIREASTLPPPPRRGRGFVTPRQECP